jgi:hypothetical protein
MQRYHATSVQSSLQGRLDSGADLLSNYLSQRCIDPVLPPRPGVLKVMKNVTVNSQSDKLLGIRDGWTLRRESAGFVVCPLARTSLS